MNDGGVDPPALAGLVIRMLHLGGGEPERRSAPARWRRHPWRTAFAALAAVGRALSRPVVVLVRTLLRVGVCFLLAAVALPAALLWCLRPLRSSKPRGELPLPFRHALRRTMRGLVERLGVCGERFVLVLEAPLTHSAVGIDLLRWVLGRQPTARLFAPLLPALRPVFVAPRGLRHHVFGLTFVLDYAGVERTLGNHESLRVTGYDMRMTRTSGSFLLGHDGPQHQQGRTRAVHAVRDGRGVNDGLVVTRLAAEASAVFVATAAARPSRSIDVVSELGDLVPLYVADQYFGVPDTDDKALLPLLRTMSFYLFNFWIGGPYDARAQQAAARLRAHLRGCIGARLTTTADVPDDVLQRVIDQARSNAGAGRPLDDAAQDAIASHLLGLLSGSIIATVGTFLNAVDVLIDLPAERLEELRKLCLQPGDTDRLDRWVDEACRIGGAYPPMLYRVAAEDVALTPQEPDVHLVARGALVVSVPWLANFDPRCFERPWRFEPQRFEEPSPAPKPLLFGSGVHRCLAEHLGHTMIREMIRALFARQCVRRVPGAEGRLQRGPKGTIPGGDFARRMLVRFDA